MKGLYRGSIRALQGMTAMTRQDRPGFVLAQFDQQRVDHIPVQPGQGLDEHLSYCFGWHEFPERDFEFTRTIGHRIHCGCPLCVPTGPVHRDQSGWQP